MSTDTDTDSLHRLAEYHTRDHERTHDLHMSLDYLRRGCRVHGLSVEELDQFLNTVHAHVAANQSIDDQMDALLDICIALERGPQAQDGSEA